MLKSTAKEVMLCAVSQGSGSLEEVALQEREGCHNSGLPVGCVSVQL